MAQAAAPNAVPTDAVPALVQFYDDARALIAAEAAVQTEHWAYLEASCERSSAKVDALSDDARALVGAAQAAEAKRQQLPALFQQIDELENNLTVLETVAQGLESYSKILEKKFVQ